MKPLLLAVSGLVLVLAACGGSHTVPKGVSEIDIRAPGIPLSLRKPSQAISRSVTDPSQIKRIIDWFDSLKRPGNTNVACAGGLAANVTFTFRSAGDAELAKANSPPAAAHACDPIHFTIRGQQETFLVDSSQGTALIDRVQRLLGTKFPVKGYLG
jgi:hypothetical protein